MHRAKVSACLLIFYRAQLADTEKNMVQSMENEVIFASMFEKELCGLQTTDLVMSICFKALAETLATVQAICMSGYPRLGFQTCKSEDEVSI